ncbi:hypothetical protein [Roseateles sp. LYH14W]|uniref:EamA domain-containing protein n=1 Tax=Pelomonas parva TaxID=3299032 RepID=A0ABW7FAT8_9BURK
MDAETGSPDYNLKQMNTPLTKAVISFNFLACLLAIAAALRHVTQMPGGMAWWEFLLSVGIFVFVIVLPFVCFLSRVLEGGGSKLSYFVIVLNLVFSVFGAFTLYYALHGKPLDSLGLFVIGLSPIALANAAWLIFKEE